MDQHGQLAHVASRAAGGGVVTGAGGPPRRSRLLGAGVGLGGMAGLVSGALFHREALLVLAVGTVAVALIALGGPLLILGKVIFHGDDGPYRRLRGLLREARGTADSASEHEGAR